MASREEMLGTIGRDDQRVQYDGKDEERLYEVGSAFTEATMAMLHALGAYQEAMNAKVDDSSADKMKEARYNLVYGWTVAQAAVSKIAWVTRIDGDLAFEKALEAAKKSEEPELAGL